MWTFDETSLTIRDENGFVVCLAVAMPGIFQQQIETMRFIVNTMNAVRGFATASVH